jgi:hypothetical protein
LYLLLDPEPMQRPLSPPFMHDRFVDMVDQRDGTTQSWASTVQAKWVRGRLLVSRCGCTMGTGRAFCCVVVFTSVVHNSVVWLSPVERCWDSLEVLEDGRGSGERKDLAGQGVMKEDGQ